MARKRKKKATIALRLVIDGSEVKVRKEIAPMVKVIPVKKAYKRHKKHRHRDDT